LEGDRIESVSPRASGAKGAADPFSSGRDDPGPLNPRDEAAADVNRSGSSRDYGVDKTHVLPLAAAAAGIGQNTSFMIDAVIVLALGSFLSFRGYGRD